MLSSLIDNQISKLSDTIDNAVTNKKILITGGAGFLGSWVCDTLLRKGNKVFCVDKLSTGLRSNIHHNIDNKNFRFLNQDVVSFQASEKFDYIIHMASRASPEEYQMHPIETLEANSFGTKSMLELARINNCPLLYTSTSEIYGDALEVPTPETYWGNVNPVGIRSCYDEAKRFGEAMIVAYQKEYGLDTRVVRIFNTYGPRIRHDGAYARAVPRFCMQALKGEDITVFGDGSQTRSFCFVSDTIVGLLLALIKNEARNQFINIGNPNEITILELANVIKHVTGSTSNIVFKDLPGDDPKRRCPVITKAENLLNWRPKIDLEKGIVITVDWFKENILNN